MWVLMSLAVIAVLAAAAPVRAAGQPDAKALAEIGADWAACQAVMKDNPQAWLGWRRSFFNGYGDDFSFWDNRASATGSRSVLSIAAYFDGIGRFATYCYRQDGSLAYIVTAMLSPNIVDGPNRDAAVSREGKVHVAPDGSVLKISGALLAKGERHPLDSKEWQLARPCEPLPLYRNLVEVEKAYVAEMGDIYGKKPAFKPEQLDWCAKAVFDPS
ncbi:hypothetical protein J8I29_25205 [Labrys sp. LIt4]|uniref:hypothetical protein n=1 Tax=Labrys sp. LIt4 TaxID=2821355 RepID=UPI001ADFCEFB|nr:hypothetical protein [Labrys sp. LIt4]MBP0582647.1 hypothetical protein [Labrys sp. LIt4]